MKTIELICSFCKELFEKEKKWVTFLRKENLDRPFYCCKECYRKDTSVKPLDRACLYCNKTFPSSSNRDSRKCCSEVCARKYSSSFSSHKGNYKSLNLWRINNPTPPKSFNIDCVNCGVAFRSNRRRKCCSDKCTKERISIGGRNSIQKQGEIRCSKNEIHFANLCQFNFNEVLKNAQMFNGWDADVILPEYKIAILWNGKWHYKKITKKHSVEQVQNRDRIKIDEIKKKGYIPYIVKDMGKENPKFVIEEFEKLKEFIAESHSGRLHCPHKAE